VARVPIMSDDEVLGLLLLVSPPQSLLGDARLLHTVGTLIAAALDHAQLYEAAYAPPPNAEDADRARHELLNAAAAELRPALVSLEAYASVVAGEETSGTIEDARRLSALSQSIERVNAMLEDIAHLGRVDESAETREPAAAASTDVARVTRVAVAAFAPALDARLQGIEVELPDEPLLAAVSGDAVERLLLHLLSNANRAAPDEGQIIVRANEDGDTVRIEVEDSGPALDLLERTHIFEPFYRVAQGLPEIPGAGLGLAVVQQLAESQGGTVWAEPRPGGGTAYYVELPSLVRTSEVGDQAPALDDVGMSDGDAEAGEAAAFEDEVTIEVEAPLDEDALEFEEVVATEDAFAAEGLGVDDLDESQLEPAYAPDDEPTQPLQIERSEPAAEEAPADLAEDELAQEPAPGVPQSEFDVETYEDHVAVETNGRDESATETDDLEMQEGVEAVALNGDAAERHPIEEEVAVGDDTDGDEEEPRTYQPS
jgi:signal transduction histidine kinase